VLDAGCNVYSVEMGGTEFLRVPEQLAQLPGVGYGTPILYPTPNRVRGAVFHFAGQEFRFPANNRGNFIHGLVHSVAWQLCDTGSSDRDAWLRAELRFGPGQAGWRSFPRRHILRVQVTVTDGAVRWDYEVDNRSGEAAVPFGFGLHPYFLYQGSRQQTYLQVPASHWMEAKELLPTGRLVPLDGTDYDLRQATSLLDRRLDDVFFGMLPERPARIEFRQVQRQVTLQASSEFTHLVVYTPDRPYFCVENQTCSTDAHNLAAAGQNEVAHLLVCPPGEHRTGWVSYRMGELAAEE
jgi:aldose 1-epimerase